MSITVHIANRQKSVPVDRRRVRLAVKAVLADAGVHDAEISVALVDDPTIAALHDEFMDDPEPTDVLSFLLDQSAGRLEGEVVASADTARAWCAKYKSSPEDELLRYVIHGTLHLVGHDDATPRQRAAMRARETVFLRGCVKDAGLAQCTSTRSRR